VFALAPLRAAAGFRFCVELPKLLHAVVMV
jgi:hypothetical protein